MVNLFAVCQIPMGVGNELIVEGSQLTSSSQLDKGHNPDKGRLPYNGAITGSWTPR